MFKCVTCGKPFDHCECMYDFSQKNCEVCGDKIGSGEGGFNFFIVEADNPPVDSICFCGIHPPIFLDECHIDWIGRIKKPFKKVI